MPRIRTVKPEFWEDESIGMLTTEARLLFIATWNLADDEGLLRWSAPYLKASVFMYDDAIDTDTVKGLMTELESSEMVYCYRGGKASQPFAYVVNFHKHQRINRPSPPKLPPPTPYARRAIVMYGNRAGWVCHICGEPVDLEAEEHRLRASLDHIQPKSKGGSNYPSNIGLAHHGCNSSKQDKAPESLRDDSVSLSVTDSRPEGKGREGKVAVAAAEQFNRDRAAAEFQKRGKQVNNPSGYIRTIATDPDFVKESERLWAHRDCEKCGGRGFYESDYAPGAGVRRIECL